MTRHSALYDEDDMYDDDYEDDADYWDDEEVAPKQPAANAKGKQPAAGQHGKGGQTNNKPATSAGASKMAQYLCDPPPLNPNGKLQPGAKKEPALATKQVPSYPVAPAAATPAAAAATPKPAEQAPQFGFDTPSPDDVVLAAQQGKGQGPSKAPQPSGTAGLIHLPQNKAMLQTPGQQQQAGGKSAADALLAMRGLNLAAGKAAAAPAAGGSDAGGSAPAAPAAPGGEQAGAASADGGAAAGRRRVSEYVMEAELAKECAAAASAEAAGAGGIKPGLHLVVLGHVDAGKSTLMGRLLHDLGHVSSKEVHKNQREAAQAGKASFSWAWLLDERPEERARGVTVDVAMSRFSTARYAVTLMDAPGHRDFVPNMITGAAQADAALLLVDGSPGGFEAGFEPAEALGFGSVGGGQTREHAQLARSLGVEQMAVVISKLDTCDYSQERFEYIKSVLGPFLKSTCGFKDSALQWLPAVGPAGENLVAPPKEPLLSSWWKGPTLVQAIDSFAPRERNTGKPLRLPVTDVFKSKSGATVVGGKLEGGAIKAGSKVLVIPGHEVATVRSIEVDGQAVPLARAGDSAEVVLAGVDVSALGAHGGFMLCHPEYPVPLVTKFEARVVVLEVPVPVIRGMQVTLHAHTVREVGAVTGLLSTLNPKTGEVTKAKPRCLLKGQTAVIEVTAARPMCLEEYGDYKPLGRIALRDGGRTVAVGILTRIVTAA